MWQAVSCLLPRIKTEIQQHFQTQRMKTDKTFLLIAQLFVYISIVK